jgi:hypothetical protein
MGGVGFRLRWAGIPLLTLAGCGSRAPPEGGAASCWQEAAPPTDDGTPLAWGILGEPALTPDGRSVPLLVPLPSGSGMVALRISDPAGTPACVQLDSVVDSDGGAWITSAAGDLGPFCLSCPQRVAVGIGYGLFVLPSNDQAPDLPASLLVVAGVRDCSTLLPASANLPARLRIEGIFAPPVEPTRAGRISLGLAFLGDSPLADEALRAAVLPETLRLVNELLAPGALQVTVARTRTVAHLTGSIELTRGDYGPLDALYGEVLGSGSCPSPSVEQGDDQDDDQDHDDDGWVPVVFSGCIQIADPLQQTTSEPDGMTPGIPSGFPPAGRADGIYLEGQSCRPGSAPINWPPSLLARLLAHELGHYLGLFHSVEADGALDQLADTDANNLMYYDPLTVLAPAFSASQFRVMRRHPAIRWSPSD